MKTTLYSMLAAAACGMAFGQTAYTNPVGYVTMNVTGGGTTSSPKISDIGTSLPRSVTFSGLSLGTGTIATVNFSGTPFTSGQFGINNLGEPKFYAEVTTGPNAGIWSDIVSNNVSSITCADAVASQFSSQTVVIREFHTLTSLFTNSSLTVPFKFAASISGADELSLVDSLSKALSVFYFSTDDGDEDGNPDGWVRANGNLAGDKVISPMDGITVKRKATDALAIIQSGEVKLTPTVIRVDQGINIVPVNRAVGNHMRLGPLTATSIAGGRTGSNLVGSGFTQAASISGSDELTVISNGLATIYYCSTDDGDEDGNADGWVFSNGNLAGNVVIPEGSSVRLKRKTATPFNWVLTPEPVAGIITGVSN